jgi:hypothetical protein
VCKPIERWKRDLETNYFGSKRRLRGTGRADGPQRNVLIDPFLQIPSCAAILSLCRPNGILQPKRSLQVFRSSNALLISSVLHYLGSLLGPFLIPRGIAINSMRSSVQMVLTPSLCHWKYQRLSGHGKRSQEDVPQPVQSCP